MARKKSTRVSPSKKKQPSQFELTAESSPFELAAQVAEHVQIVDVQVLESRSRQNSFAMIQDLPSALNSIKSVAHRIEKASSLLFVEASFELRLFQQNKKRPTAPGEAKPSDSAAMVEIDCTLLLVYRVSTPETVQEPQLKAFAEVNGIYNAYPYWREFAQSMAARMGVPGLVVPVFRFD